MAMLLVIVIVFLVVLLVPAVVVLVNHRVPPATGYKVAVDWEGRHECYGKRNRQAPPEQEVQGARIHSTGYEKYYQVVHYLHHHDRECIRGKRQWDRRSEGHLPP